MANQLQLSLGTLIRKWSQDVRKSVSDGIQLCGAILADLEKQDWQQLEQDFEVSC